MNSSIITKNLSKVYFLNQDKRNKKIIEAIKNVNLKFESKNIYGLIGENGSGKTTFLKIISEIIPYSSGKVERNGKILYLTLDSLFGELNDNLSAYDCVKLEIKNQSLKNNEIKKKIKEIESFVDIGEFFYEKIYTYSTGMKARIAFALKFFFVDTNILILDEVLSVGDFKFNKKCKQLLKSSIKKIDIILIVSHSINVLEDYCNKLIIFNEGEIIFSGDFKSASKKYNNLLNEKKYNYLKTYFNEENRENINFLSNNKVVNSIACNSELSIEVKCPNIKKKIKYSLFIKIQAVNGELTFKKLFKNLTLGNIINIFFENNFFGEDIYIFNLDIFEDKSIIESYKRILFIYDDSSVGGIPLYKFEPNFKIRRL